MKGSTYERKLSTSGRAVEHVVVVHPYTYKNPYTCFPPIGAEYVQAGAVKAGLTATLLDMRYEEGVNGAFESADVVFLYGFFEDCSLFGKRGIHAIDELLREVPRDTPVVAGGVPFGDAEETLRQYPGIDVVVAGMPNMPVRELLESGSPAEVRNLTWRSDEGPVRNPRVTHRLSEDVWPLRRLRNPAYRYHSLGIPIDLVRSAQGCNYKCRFCYQYGKDTDGGYLRWQGRSPESQFREIQEIEAPVVLWVDDDFTTDMDALDGLADLLIGNRVEKVMIGTGRIDHVLRSDVARLRKLERAGLLALSFGVESLTDKTLRFFRKAQTVDMAERAMAMMAQTNILLICNFLLGSPGETEEDMREFLRFARRWKVDHLVTNRLRVPEGSELHGTITGDQGRPLPGMDRIRGRPLKRIKSGIKFGQETPWRLALSYLKLCRHRGLPYDPLFFVWNAIGALGRHTWLERTGLLPALLRFPLWWSRQKFHREMVRAVARLATPPAEAVAAILDIVDERIDLSTRILPAVADLFNRKVLVKQKAREQVAGRAFSKAPRPA